MSKSDSWKMARAELTPERMRHAKKKLSEIGYSIVKETDTYLQVYWRCNLATFYPFTGTYTVKGVPNGRGLQNFLNLLTGKSSCLVDSK